VRLAFPRIIRGVLSARAFPWVLSAVLLATTLTNWWLLRDERAEDTRKDQVAQTATEFLGALTTFSADTIDQDVERIRSFAVGDFARQVDETFSGARIAQIKRADVKSTSTVQSVFVQEIDDDTATVFSVVNERVTNKVSPAPRTDVLRVELTLINTLNGWRIEQVRILQSPVSTGVVPTG
jgi:Mce-associated membrane protein